MIRKLRLTNWRNYESVSLDLAAGTTFIVASNGVGKTSLVEAARWALFGVPPSPTASPVRLGNDSASATVELVTPDGQVILVERTLPGKISRQPAEATIHLDGQRIDTPAYEAILRESFGTEPSFLAKLTMPAPTPDLDAPSALGLEDHLGRYFGVDSLQRAIEGLNAELKGIEKEIRLLKVANASTAQQLVALESSLSAADSRAQLATSSHSEAVQALDDLRERRRLGQMHDAWKDRKSAWASQTEELVGEIAKEVGEPVSRSDLGVRLRSVDDQLAEILENQRVAIGILKSRIASVRANQAKLDHSADDCPVCRRPLDETTIELAQQANVAEIEELESEIEESRAAESSAAEHRGRVQALTQRWNQIPDPGPEPDTSGLPIPSQDEVDLAGRKVSAALEQLVAARASLVEAERNLDQAREANDAMRQLEGLFRKEAYIRVALETSQKTLDELLDQTVRPIASEVAQRWTALFPNRGNLSTRADGTMTRSVDGYPLPYSAFSTGEGMGATIVLRLLVAQMATRADFCWFDEPLEHLDPDVRRHVANILSRATDAQFRQIVVTTYEEPLARRLQARTPDRVRLIDVRATPVNA